MKKLLLRCTMVMLVIVMMITSLPLSSYALTQKEQEDIYRVSTFWVNGEHQEVKNILNSDRYLYHLDITEGGLVKDISYEGLALIDPIQKKQLYVDVLTKIMGLLQKDVDKISQQEAAIETQKEFFELLSEYVIDSVSGEYETVKTIYEAVNFEAELRLSSKYTANSDVGQMYYSEIYNSIYTYIDDPVIREKAKETLETYTSTNNWLKNTQKLSIGLELAELGVNLCKDGLDLLIDLRTYEKTSEKYAELLIKIYHNTTDLELKSACLDLANKLSSEYRENFVNGIVSKLGGRVVESIGVSVIKDILSNANVFAKAAIMGIDAGELVSDWVFNTEDIKQYMRSIYTINVLSEELVFILKNEFANIKRYNEPSTELAKHASDIIYHMNILIWLRMLGEQSYYKLKDGAYSASLVKALDNFGLINTSGDVKTIDAWFTTTIGDIIVTKEYLFKQIPTEEYYLSESKADFDSLYNEFLSVNKEYVSNHRTATIENGIYNIKNISSGLMMNVYAGKNTDMTNVVTWEKDGTVDQKFYIEHVNNGKYIIYAVCSAKGNGYARCLDIYTGAANILPKSGDNIDIFTRNNTWNDAQYFYIEPMSDGSYVLECSSVGGLVITASDPTKNNGNICVSKYTGSNSQKWMLVPVENDNNSTDTSDWDALVGTTIATIKQGSSYAKWYNSSNNVSAAAGYIGQCTWYALGRFYEVTGINLGRAPHAKYWLRDNAQNSKIKILNGVEKVIAQSIAVDTNGTYGHVLFIEHVTYNSNGNPEYIYFTECNWDCNGVYNSGSDCILQKMTYSQFVTKRGADGYIVSASASPTTPQLIINYNANGGSIPAANVIGEAYKVITAGLNVRDNPGESNTKIGLITKNTPVRVTEKQEAGEFIWGKITYQGKEGWIALGSDLVIKTEIVYDQQYSVNNSMIYKTGNSQIHSLTCAYGAEIKNGLYNDTTFGLYRDGYTFKGWSLSATGDTVIDQNTAFNPEDLVASLTNGNQTVTVYAVWEQDIPPVTDYTVEKIYLSSIPNKQVYYVGDTVDASSISIIVEHTDGSVEVLNDGFICSPSVVAAEGKQEIKVIFEGKTASFDIVATKSKARENNATSKVNSVGHFLPSASSATLLNIGGTYKDDIMQVLCKDGDFYLCLFPWNGTTVTKENGVLMYFDVDDIQVNGNVPTAAEFYSLNPTGEENAVVISDTKIYYKPDGGANPVKYNGNAVAENTVSTGTRIRVLFEMEGYYCIQTDKFTGFVTKNSVKLDASLYEIKADVSQIDILLGNDVDVSAQTVKGTKTDNSTVELTMSDCSVSLPDVDMVGEKYAIVTYGDLSTLIKISVTEIKINEILIDSMPDKTVYVVGEKFDPSGMKLKAVYDDDNVEDITDKAIINSSFEECGISVVQIKFEELVIYIPVTVYEQPEIEIWDVGGYTGQNVSVPISYFCSDVAVVPTSFEATVSYSSDYLKFIEIGDSELNDASNLRVEALDNDTLIISYESQSPIPADCILLNLVFAISDDADSSDTYSMVISIDSIELNDSLGNTFDVNITNGSVYALEVETETTTDTETETTAETESETVAVTESETVAEVVSETVVESESATVVETEKVTEVESATTDEMDTDTVIETEEETYASETADNESDLSSEENTETDDGKYVQIYLSGCQSSVMNGGNVLAVLIIGIACIMFFKKERRE